MGLYCQSNTPDLRILTDIFLCRTCQTSNQALAGRDFPMGFSTYLWSFPSPYTGWIPLPRPISYSSIAGVDRLSPQSHSKSPGGSSQGVSFCPSCSLFTDGLKRFGQSNQGLSLQAISTPLLLEYKAYAQAQTAEDGGGSWSLLP